MSFNAVGKVYSPEMLQEHLKSVKPPEWAKAICLHHTGAPSLLQRPQGLLAQHIKNIQSFYQNEKGWSSGPHLFIDEDQCYCMTPLTEKGVHAASFNGKAIGIEVLGDYDSESHNTGRGLECWKTTAAATKVLLTWLGLPINYNTVLFHRDDPKTNKTCPGRRVEKDWVIGLIRNADIAAPTPKAKINADILPSYAPVGEYLKQFRGYSDADIKTLLRRDQEGLFFFGDDWLEGAYYDKVKQATVAPIPELGFVKPKGYQKK